MAAKVLLGVVALAAIVGSPIAYSHFNSPVVETQQEERREDQQPERQLAASSKPEVPQAPPVPPTKGPEVQAQPKPSAKDEANEDAKADGVKAPEKDDKCNIGDRNTWQGMSPISPEMKCVREITTSTRTSH